MKRTQLETNDWSYPELSSGIEESNQFTLVCDALSKAVSNSATGEVVG